MNEKRPKPLYNNGSLLFFFDKTRKLSKGKTLQGESSPTLLIKASSGARHIGSP